MTGFLAWISWLVTVRPYVTILVLILITVLLAAGATRRAPVPDTASTLPDNSAVAEALDELDELFGESGEANVVTLLFRGDAITPSGLSQMDSLISEIISDPAVSPLLVPSNPVLAPSLFVEGVLQVDGFESVDQAQIDSATQVPADSGSHRRDDRGGYGRHPGGDCNHSPPRHWRRADQQRREENTRSRDRG